MDMAVVRNSSRYALDGGGGGGAVAAATLAARHTLICALRSAAAAFGSAARETPRDTGTSRPRPSGVSAAAHAAARSPPCAPTPGARIHSPGAAARARRSACASVAPTTRPTPPAPDPRLASQSAQRPATRSYTHPPSRTWSSCTSAEPGLLVLHSTNTPRAPSPPSRNGCSESPPMYLRGAMVSWWWW